MQMADRVLTLRELNRTLLSRQMLLQRESISIPDALERLVGMQAQLSSAPYVGLWTRLNDFQRDDLAKLIEDRRVVKATMMRATLHLTTADDYLRFRATLQPVLAAASGGIVADRVPNLLDLAPILDAARKFIAEQPRSFAEISEMLSQLQPDTDVGAMRYSVRTHLPLVQVPTDTRWSFPGNPKFTLAETWIGKSMPDEDRFEELVYRYLAAFGPATVADIETWSGFYKLKPTIEKLKPKLRVYSDGKKGEWLDLPDLDIPDADTPAPIRFLPEFDNILLSHKNRTRILADAYRKQVYLPGLRVAATILVDGFVAGVWKVERKKSDAMLTITPFESLSKPIRADLEAEAERLIRFMESDAKNVAVKIAE